jgi:hypothetical protein
MIDVFYKINCVQVDNQNRVGENIPEIFEIRVLNLRKIARGDMFFVFPSPAGNVL